MDEIRLCSCGNPPRIVSNGSMDVLTDQHIVVRCDTCGWVLQKEFRYSTSALKFWNSMTVSVSEFNSALQLVEGW